jgi:hypothetical protein
MNIKLIYITFFFSILFGSGGYDHGTSAGKGNLDISLTFNPFNYFEQGQSYMVLGYGITNRFDFHGYFSANNKDGNYYAGFSYQFYKSSKFDFSTAIGIRKYVNNSITHIFTPQLLYTFHLNNRIDIGGSIVEIRNQNLKTSLGVASDLFLKYKFFENQKYKIELSLGAFNPVLWQPKNGDWYPTYSIDIKFKR